MRQILFCFFLFIFFSSCKKSTSKENQSSNFPSKTEKSTTDKVEDKFTGLSKEIFYATGDCILFLKPSDEYFNKYLKEEEGIEEVSSDFEFHANQFYKDQKDNYKIYFVDQRMVALVNKKKDTTFIDRYNRNLIYGAIIQRKDSTQILKGVQTEIDLKMALGIFNPIKKNSGDFKIISSDGVKRSVDYNYLENNLFDYDLDYKKIGRKIFDKKVVFSESDVEVTVFKDDFKKDNYKIGSNKFGVTINNQTLRGVDGGLPKEVIKNIAIKFNDLEFALNKKDFEFLSEPNFSGMLVYKIDNDNIVLEMNNSDGAGGYRSYTFINREGKVKTIVNAP